MTSLACFVFQTWSHYVAQISLKCLGSSDPPVPSLPSGARTTGHYHSWPTILLPSDSSRQREWHQVAHCGFSAFPRGCLGNLSRSCLFLCRDPGPSQQLWPPLGATHGYRIPPSPHISLSDTLMSSPDIWGVRTYSWMPHETAWPELALWSLGSF